MVISCYFSWRVTCKSKLSYLTSLKFDQVLQQSKLKALILDLIHNIDVIDDLLNHKVQRISEWHWFRQLRQYLKTNCAPDQKTSVRQNANTVYSFEYQGKREQVGAATPDRQVFTWPSCMACTCATEETPTVLLAQWKTESVKALGACLARQVVVFNCDEGIDFQAMGRIFINFVLVSCMGVFSTRSNRPLGRADECHLPERSWSKLRSRPTQRLSPCLAGRSLWATMRVLHYRESSHEMLRWATEVAGQSEAAIQACSDKPTQQWADRGGDDVGRGFFKSAKIMAQNILALFLAVGAAAFYAATLRVGTPFAENPSCLSQVRGSRTTSTITMNRPTIWRRRSCWSRRYSKGHRGTGHADCQNVAIPWGLKSANWRWCLGKAAKGDCWRLHLQPGASSRWGDCDHNLFNPRDLTLWVMQLLRLRHRFLWTLS